MKTHGSVAREGRFGLKRFAKILGGWLGRLKGLFRRFRRPLALDVASVCEKGLVRPDNQDHFASLPDRSAFCVADGMGGGEGGAEASAIMCRAFDEWMESRRFEGRVDNSYDAVLRANMDILQYARSAHYDKMATTVAFLLVDPGPDRHGVVGYVGDSRVYRFRKGRLEPLTLDHTIAGDLIRDPSLRARVDSLGWRENQLSHVLTRAVGMEFYIEVEWRRTDVRPGDAYILCTDGVYDMVGDDGLAEVLAAGKTSAETVAEIERRVVAAGAADNYTMIVVRVGEGPSR